MTKLQCGGCNLFFGSLGAFDGHRVGSYGEPIYATSSTGGKQHKVVGYLPSTRRCLTVEEMQAKGWRTNERGWWITNEVVSFWREKEEGRDINPP